MLDENGLGDHGTEAARAKKPADRKDDMKEKHDEMAHHSIVARTANAGNYGAIYQFAIDWPKSGWLFPSPDPAREGKPYSQQRVFDWHHAALEKCGVEPFEPYCLRHTALTRLAKSCRNPYAVAKAAGHSTITMTYRYIHPEEEEIRAAYEIMSGSRIGNAARRDILKVVGKKEEPQDPHNITTAASADQSSYGASEDRE